MDDAADNNVQERTSNLFHPDARDATRNGIGIVVACRAMQWSQVQAQDIIFWLYDITNIGTTIYRKADFGEVVGGCVGDVGQNYVDCQDDLGFFDVNNNLTYTWDSDDRTNDPLWICLNRVLTGVRKCIGYCGYAYLRVQAIRSMGSTMTMMPSTQAVHNFKRQTLHITPRLVHTKCPGHCREPALDRTLIGRTMK